MKKRSSETFHVYTVTTYATMLNIGKYTAIKENLEMDALQVFTFVSVLVSPNNKQKGGKPQFVIYR